MAFFDKISNKAKEFADTTKVNQKINDERKRMAELKTALAELVFNKYNSGQIDDADIKSGCDKIKECYANIDVYYEEINRIKAETEAANKAADDAKTANRNTTAGAAAESAYTCSKCGKTIAVGQKFCMNCGAAVPPPETESKSDQDEAKPAPAFCTNCGEKLNKDQRFCSVCGKACR